MPTAELEQPRKDEERRGKERGYRQQAVESENVFLRNEGARYHIDGIKRKVNERSKLNHPRYLAQYVKHPSYGSLSLVLVVHSIGF